MHSMRTPKIEINAREWDNTFQLISWWNKEDVRSAKVMVVGAGALGNEVLKNLALLNVGNVLIVDFDTIEYSNLSRSVLFRESDCGKLKAEVAASRVKEINSNVKVQTIQGDIMLDVGLGVFRQMDVVIGCLDNRLARLYINRHCHKVNKTWVDGAIENLAGQLCVYQPGISCYECQLTDVEWENIKQKLGCADIAQRNSSQGRIPTTPISSSIIAAMQTQEALKVIHNNEKRLSAGKKFYYEGMNNEAIWFPFGGLLEDCISHFTYESIKEAHELSAESSISDALQWLSDTFYNEKISIELDYELALELTTKKTEKSYSTVVPQPHLTNQLLQKYQEEPGEDVLISKGVHDISYDFPRKDLTLKSVGIPELHILRVRAGEEYHYVELSGDKHYLKFD